jgi:NADH-quinone oxidoreductase subunit J
MIAAVVFYVLSAVLLASGVMVISSRNPVHSVLFLILAFFNGAGLFLLAGAEFLAMILVVVYVGTVAVLFLFVVMMLDVDFTELRSGFQRYLPVGLALGVVLLTELVGVFGSWTLAPDTPGLRSAPTIAGVSNTAQLGRLIYTDYVLLFQIAGLVLLVAMIGAIVLTLRDRKAARRQNIARQEARTPAMTMSLVDVPLGVGVSTAGVRRQDVEGPTEALAEATQAPAHEGSH